MTKTSLRETTNVSQDSSTFDLQISNPAALLNEIARRYESSERILMEFVDNALDDVEPLYRANADAYPFEIKIDVILDSSQRKVTVRDNCRGMRRETLERIVERVGESQKKGITWVNGQFGFGVHAFRAASEIISFRTKNAEDSHIELSLSRDQHRGIRRPWEISEPFPTDTGTGTEVTVGPFDEEWFENISADSIKREIERHFERLLARPNLVTTVQEIGESVLHCEPFDYAQVPGEEFDTALDLELNGRLYQIEIRLKASEIEIPDRAARFFARGRRINEIAEIKSFIRKSLHRTSIWGHPHLLGYIEVGEIVRPVITRDDFQQTKGRTVLYEAILGLEDEIKEALSRINDAQRDSTLNRLEDVLRDVLDELSREDRLRLRSELAVGRERGAMLEGGGNEGGDEGGPHRDESERDGGWEGGGEGADDGPDPEKDGPQGGQSEGGQRFDDDPLKAEGAQRKRAGFDIKFGNFPPDADGKLRRSRLVDGIIYINTAHTDFHERMAQTRQGKPKFTDRLGAYLAATVSIHYKDQFYLRYGRQPDRRDQMFDEQVEFMCRLETAMRPRLPLLQQEFNGTNGEEAVDE
jgi:hypothetical protein